MEAGAKASFSAVTDVRTRVVILGSLPGEISLQRRQYNANPTNQFWRLIGVVIEQDLVALDYPQRLEALLQAGVGLWDVIKSAQRQGSGDGAIRRHQAHTLQEFADSLPQLNALAFNGQKSASIGRRQLAPARRHALLELPSSSAAYCSIGFDQKKAAWLRIRAFLT